MRRIKRYRAGLLFSLCFFIVFSNQFVVYGSKSTPVFSDTSRHWAKSSIEIGASVGLVSGYSNGKFGPNDKISKEQLLTLVIRTLGVEDPSANSILQPFTPFQDISNDRWSAPFIKWATQMGWVKQSDYPDFKFNPSNPITRQEAAKFIAFSLGGTEVELEFNSASNNKFSDDSKINSKYKTYVYFLKDLGIIEGNKNLFQPTSSLTRAEAVVLLLRVLSLKSNLLAYTNVTEGNNDAALALSLTANYLQQNENSLAIMGAANIREEKWQDAITAYKAAIESGYYNPYAETAIAYAEYNLGNFKEAYEHQKKGLSVITQDPLQYLLFAEYALQTDHDDEALTAATQAKKLDKNGTYSDILNSILVDTSTSKGPITLASLHNDVLFKFPANNYAFNLKGTFNAVSNWIDDNKEAIKLALTVTAIVTFPVTGTAAAIIAGTSMAIEVGIAANSAYQAMTEPALTEQQRKEKIRGAIRDGGEALLPIPVGAATKKLGTLGRNLLVQSKKSEEVILKSLDDAITNKEYEEIYRTSGLINAQEAVTKSREKLLATYKGTEVVYDMTKRVDDGIEAVNDYVNKEIIYKEPPKEISIFKSWIGEWSNKRQFETSSLEIKNVTETTLEFEHNTFNGHTGSLSGTAKISGNKAIYHSGDKELLSGEECIAIITADANQITIEPSYCSGFAGLNGFLGDTYSKIKSAEVEIKLDVDFRDPIIEESFKELVGTNYEKFALNMQILYQEENLDDIEATIISGFKRGSAGESGIIMYNSKREIWAAVSDYDTVWYYTNVPSYFTKMPKTFTDYYKKSFNQKVKYMSN